MHLVAKICITVNFLTIKILLCFGVPKYILDFMVSLDVGDPDCTYALSMG